MIRDRLAEQIVFVFISMYNSAIHDSGFVRQKLRLQTSKPVTFFDYIINENSHEMITRNAGHSFHKIYQNSACQDTVNESFAMGKVLRA